MNAPGPPTPRKPPKLGRFETLGAWLHIWTPPRDAVVPPVPKGKLAVAVVVVAVAVGGAVLAVAPGIESGKRQRADRERATRARLEAAKRRRLSEEGRLRSARVQRPTQPLGARAELRARRRLVGALEASITGDARARAREGRLDGPVLQTRCTIEPPSQRVRERDLRVLAATYECLAITGHDPEGRFDVGDAFRATVRYRDFSYMWRRVCLPPGEGSARLEC
jgi:hypothetical protein